MPLNKTRRMAWLQAIGRTHWFSLSKQAVVCSIHFEDEYFDRTSACGIVRLRENAIPSKFVPSVNYASSDEEISYLVKKSKQNSKVKE